MVAKANPGWLGCLRLGSYRVDWKPSNTERELTHDRPEVHAQAERGSKQEAAERDVYFMRQTISNACGTIALLHAVGNNTDELSIGAGPSAAPSSCRLRRKFWYVGKQGPQSPCFHPQSSTGTAPPSLPAARPLHNRPCVDADRGSFFEDFFQQTGGMDPVARAAFLESPPAGAPDIEKAHEVWAALQPWLRISAAVHAVLPVLLSMSVETGSTHEHVGVRSDTRLVTIIWLSRCNLQESGCWV